MAEPVKNNGTNTKVVTPATKKTTALAEVKKGVVDIVADMIDKFIANKELLLPKNYSVDNAMKSAWLKLQDVQDRNFKPALEVCTKQSIANALLDMVVQGLNPGKNQVYFIVYGTQLQAQRSYFGSMAVAQMVNPDISEFAYAVVYEGDTFKYGINNGKKTVTLHEQDIENVDKKKIVAAYCIALDKSGNPLRTEIATIDEIYQSWKQSKMKPFDDKGNLREDSTHGKFTSEMALKTIINKTCKLIINASSDNQLLRDTMKRSEDLSDRAVVGIDIDEKANQGPVIDIEANQKKEGAEILAVQEPDLEAERDEPEKRATTGRGPGF